MAKLRKPRIKTEEQKRRNAASTRRHKYKVKYGISPEDFDATVAHQNGACPICMMAPSNGLRVDFSHGTVRGVVCVNCIQALKEWDGRDVDLIAATTVDPLILRMVNYLRHPSGLRKAEDVQHEGGSAC